MPPNPIRQIKNIVKAEVGTFLEVKTSKKVKFDLFLDEENIMDSGEAKIDLHD